jgi:hypothetical protein
MFLHKSLWPRSLTLPFEPFRFLLRILGDIHIRKSTPRMGESSTRLPGVSIFVKPLNNSIVIVHYIPGLFFAKLVLQRHGSAVKSSENRHQINFFFELRLPYHRSAEPSTPRLERYAELSTLRIRDTRSQGLSDSPYHWCGESTTLWIIDTESFLLKNSIADTESRLLNFLKKTLCIDLNISANSKPKSEWPER